METLGSLCDKLVVVELKIFHTRDVENTSLKEQERKLCEEIDRYVVKATVGKIDPGDLTFESNKVYNSKITLPEFHGSIGELVVSLSMVNCELWHEVDKSYRSEMLQPKELFKLVKNLAVLNLQRNKCIEAIDAQFKGQVTL